MIPPHRPTVCMTEIMPGAKLPKLKMYFMTPREMEELLACIDKNVARRYIQPVKLRMVAPMIFKEKKDGSLRLCVDYRGLNCICIENMYPLPVMMDMLSFLAKGRIFTNLDLRERDTTE